LRSSIRNNLRTPKDFEFYTRDFLWNLISNILLESSLKCASNDIIIPTNSKIQNIWSLQILQSRIENGTKNIKNVKDSRNIEDEGQIYTYSPLKFTWFEYERNIWIIYYTNVLIIKEIVVLGRVAIPYKNQFIVC